MVVGAKCAIGEKGERGRRDGFTCLVPAWRQRIGDRNRNAKATEGGRPFHEIRSVITCDSNGSVVPKAWRICFGEHMGEEEESSAGERLGSW